MPRTTHAYEFESVIWDWVRGVSPPAAGSHAMLSLTIANGAIDSVHAWRRGSGPAAQAEIDRLKGETRSWIFYDPFDAPEYAWLAWENIDRATMEALIGAPLPAVEPFRDLPRGGTAISEFPASWDVMF